jgi:hypothetical protein
VQPILKETFTVAARHQAPRCDSASGLAQAGQSTLRHGRILFLRCPAPGKNKTAFGLRGTQANEGLRELWGQGGLAHLVADFVTRQIEVAGDQGCVLRRGPVLPL